MASFACFLLAVNDGDRYLVLGLVIFDTLLGIVDFLQGIGVDSFLLVGDGTERINCVVRLLRLRVGNSRNTVLCILRHRGVVFRRQREAELSLFQGLRGLGAVRQIVKDLGSVDHHVHRIRRVHVVDLRAVCGRLSDGILLRLVVAEIADGRVQLCFLILALRLHRIFDMDLDVLRNGVIGHAMHTALGLGDQVVVIACVLVLDGSEDELSVRVIDDDGVLIRHRDFAHRDLAVACILLAVLITGFRGQSELELAVSDLPQAPRLIAGKVIEELLASQGRGGLPCLVAVGEVCLLRSGSRVGTGGLLVGDLGSKLRVSVIGDLDVHKVDRRIV